MISLTLTKREAEVLHEVLDQQHNTLLMEIANTDTRQYRVSLQEREELLRRITDQLEWSETGS